MGRVGADARARRLPALPRRVLRARPAARPRDARGRLRRGPRHPRPARARAPRRRRGRVRHPRRPRSGGRPRRRVRRRRRGRATFRGRGLRPRGGLQLAHGRGGPRGLGARGGARPRAGRAPLREHDASGRRRRLLPVGRAGLAVRGRRLVLRPAAGRDQGRAGRPRDDLPGQAFPLETFPRALEDAGLLVEALREPRPADDRRVPRYERWRRIPMFLQLRAPKP